MTNSPSVVYFSLHTQFPNLGDCVINELLLRELAKDSQVRITHRRAPRWLLERLLQVPNVSIVHSKANWYLGLIGDLLRRSPVAFVFKPGHHWISSHAKSIFYTLALVVFCGLIRLMGGRVVRLGISLSPMHGWQRRLQTWLGNLHQRFGLRDQKSLEYAQQLKIGSALYTPDMAFLLASGWPGCDSVGDAKMTDDHLRPYLSVSFRDNGPLPDTSFRQRLCHQLQSASQELGQQIVVVEQVTFDHAIAQDLASRMECDSVRFCEDAESMCEVFDQYRASRLVISNRLHSLLFAWSAGCIPVPMIENSQHSKIGDLFGHLGLSELVIGWESLDQLPQHCAMLMSDEVGLRQRLREIMQQQQLELQRAIAGCMN